MLRSMRPLIQRGFKVTMKYAIPCLHHVRESPHLSRRIPSKFRKYKRAIGRPRTHLLNFSFAFIVLLLLFFFFFLFLFSASKNDDSLMFKGRMCLYRFIVIAQSLDEFPPFLFLGSNSLNIWDPYYSHAHGLLLLATLL